MENKNEDFENEIMRENLIDRAMDIDQMRFVDDVEEKIDELRDDLLYFDLDIWDLYFK